MVLPARGVWVAALLALLVACGGGGGGTDAGVTTVQGVVQKGPFVRGSDVTVQGLNANLAATGAGYFTRTVADDGSFTLDVPIRDPYVEVRTVGYYFNEVSGALSAGPLSLSAIVPLAASGATPVQVNLLTTLERGRIVTLMRGGMSFAEARQRAEREILQALHLPPESAGGLPFTAFDMARSGTAAQALIAVSSMIQGANTEAQLTELLSRLSADLADDGALQPALAAELEAQAQALDPDSIRRNLQRRFDDLGRTTVVPDPGVYVDAARTILPPVVQVEGGDPSKHGLVVTGTPATAGTVVYYRTDDALSTPGPWLTGGAWKPLVGGLQFYPHPGTLVVSLYAQSPSLASRRSEVVTRTVTLDSPRTNAPTFLPAAGTYAADPGVVVSGPTNDTAIHYTTDGTDPTPESPLYTAPIPLAPGSTTLIKALAIVPGSVPSTVVTSWYRIDPAYVDQGWPGFASVEAARQGFVGRWIGRARTPWTFDYNGTFDFLPDGSYTVRTLSDAGATDSLDWTCFLYYGTCADLPAHVLDVQGLDADGSATGLLVIGDDASWVLDLKGARMSADGRHLRFDLWNGAYGPMHYELTRLP